MYFWEENGSSVSQNFLAFYGIQVSRPYSPKATICPYPEPELWRIAPMKMLYKNDNSDFEKSEHKKQFLEVCRSKAK